MTRKVHGCLFVDVTKLKITSCSCVSLKKIISVILRYSLYSCIHKIFYKFFFNITIDARDAYAFGLSLHALQNSFMLQNSQISTRY